MSALSLQYSRKLTALSKRSRKVVVSRWDALSTFDDAACNAFYDATAPIVRSVATASAGASSGYASLLTKGAVAAVPDLLIADKMARIDDAFDVIGARLGNGDSFAEAVSSARSFVDALGADSVFSTAREAVGVVSPDLGSGGWVRQVSGSACEWCLSLSSVVFRSADAASFGHNRCDCVPVPEGDLGDHNDKIRSAKGWDDNARRQWESRDQIKQIDKSAENARARAESTRQQLRVEKDPDRRIRLERRAADWDDRAKWADVRGQVLRTGDTSLYQQI